jgi:hypothetical protein
VPGHVWVMSSRGFAAQLLPGLAQKLLHLVRLLLSGPEFPPQPTIAAMVPGSAIDSLNRLPVKGGRVPFGYCTKCHH